ncbi:alpha/beta hydrolase family protein [Microvirga arabica]|uniref:Alpha/beta hydrolase family protein n=1 Tax=Microvirga arabica TaxID=1128671 RepID=A0ABV6Y7P4_9HYPH
MRRSWSLFAAGWIIILAGALLAYFTQTSNGIRIQDVRFTGTNGIQMSALLYLPPNATAKTPAPGILAVHGYINSRETQAGFAIEFARRGYVVLALDQTGHGYSDPPAFANGYGGPAGLKYLRSLDVVDGNNIGLEGHSMGGWTILRAAEAYPDGYKAMVLEGSSTGSGRAPEGTLQYPRNLALVFSQYDEFAPLMWNVPRAKDVAQSEKLWKVFGTTGPVSPGQIYGSIADGTARVLYTPAVTHPGDHISHEAIGYSLDWFARTLQGGTPLPSSDQIWFHKEIGTLVALVGFVVLLLGTFGVLLGQPYFAQMAHPPAVARTSRGAGWWLTVALSAFVPVLTFFPFLLWGAAWMKASPLFPQSITNQILVWALLNALISLVLSFVLRGPKAEFRTSIVPSILIALATVGVGYLSLALADFFFKVDFRFWVVGLKLMSLKQFLMFLVYLPGFVMFFVIVLRSLFKALPVAGESAFGQTMSVIAALALGFLIFLAVQYIPLFLNGQIFSADQPLLTIVAIQFLPLMVVVGLIGTYTYRRTGSYLPGGLICGLFVTWYIVAGQATQAAV